MPQRFLHLGDVGLVIRALMAAAGPISRRPEKTSLSVMNDKERYRVFELPICQSETFVTDAQVQPCEVLLFETGDNRMAGQSPLRGRPLRNPGDSVDEEIGRQIDGRFADFLFFAAGFCLLASIEWIGYLARIPRQPIAMSCAAIIAVAFASRRFVVTRKQVRQLRLGRDGERCVGQYLERLRASDSQVFHDIPAVGFNLDHVVISPHGIYAVETKTFTKPSATAKVTVEGTTLRVAGRIPDRNPVDQAAAGARWLGNLLRESTGKQFQVRGVVVFPGWFVEQSSPREPVWVLEPKMLPGFIEQEPTVIEASDVALASFHLSRYVRAVVEKAA